MKIPTIKRLFTGRHCRKLAMCFAALMAVAMGGPAQAQSSGLMGYLSQAPGQGLSFGSGQQGIISNAGQNYRVMNASTAQIRTAADANRRSSIQQAGVPTPGSIGAALNGKQPVQQVGFKSGCKSCGTSSCGGSCGSYSAGGMGKYVSGGGFACGSTCDPYYFATIEALYIERRGEERFTLSPDFGMDGFDFEWGTRFTIGSVPDCIHGCEFTFTGPMDWDMSGSIVDTAGGLGTLLAPGNPVAPGSLSTFSNATFQSQTYYAEYWSGEANKTLIGWDVVKLLFGARYVNYDEEYNYFSQNAASQTGLLRSTTDNQLFGAQVGLDLLYPVGRFAYTDFRARAGMFLNLADSNVNLANAGSLVLNNDDDDEEIAGLFELGMGYRYHLGEMLTLRGGTEMWYLTGVATAPDQVSNIVRPTTGSRIRMDDDIFFYGLTVSAELRY